MMNTSDALFQFYNQFTLFNPDDFIFVVYEPTTHVLKFSQGSKVMRLPAIRSWYLPDSSFRCGLLVPSSTHKLMRSLQDLIMNPGINFNELIISPYKLKTEIYYINAKSPVPYPMRYATIRYVSITNKFLIRLLCKFRYDSELNPYKNYIMELNSIKS